MPRFTLRTRTADFDGNITRESLAVKAAQIPSSGPTVSFTFPEYVSVSEGNGNNPYWPSGTYYGFAFCKVVPSIGNNGTGKFYVQHYYDSGNYPNYPNRRFSETFRGTGTTLDGQWNLNTSEIVLTGDAGVGDLGFASQTDISGLRQALILSTEDQGTSSTGGAVSIDPVRFGGRTPDTDGVLLAYHHDQAVEKLYTIDIEQIGKQSGSDSDKTSWPDGTFIFMHPYHYAPLYENGSINNKTVQPHIVVIEDGSQYPVRGVVTISGSTLTGQYSSFLSELSSGTAVKFPSNEEWYIISGISSDTSATIYTYGDSLYYSGVAAQAAKYTVGSGNITVLSYLPNCASWGVKLSPKYNDGANIPGDSVVYTAGLTGSVSPSGTATYDWTIVTDNGTIQTTQFYANSGNTFEVEYEQDIKKNVTVEVSGSGQPACVHSDSTGLIELIPGADAGTWTCAGKPIIDQDATAEPEGSRSKWNRLNPVPSGVYIHHWTKIYGPPRSSLYGTPSILTSTLKVASGGTDKFPSRGTLILVIPDTDAAASNATNGRFKYIWGTYTGKSTKSSYDEFTGITWQKQAYWTGSFSAGGRITGVGSVSTSDPDAGLTNASSANYWYVYLQSTHHWPITWITGKNPDGRTVKVEDLRKIREAQHPDDADPRKMWIWKYQSIDVPKIVTVTSYNLSTNEITFSEDLGSYGGVGAILSPAVWFSPRSGNVDYLPSSTDRWNVWGMSYLQLNAYISPAGSDIIRYFPATYDFPAGEYFDLLVIDYMSKMLEQVTGGNGSTYRFINIPYQGRIIIPKRNRKNIVIEYGSWDIYDEGSATVDPTIRLKNCRVIESESTKESNGEYNAYLGGPAFIHKQFYGYPLSGGTGSEWTITSLDYSDYSLELDHFVIDQLNKSVLINYIQASKSLSQTTGDVATPIADPVFEKVWPNFPTGAIVQVDPLYIRSDNETASDSGSATGGTGGCFLKDTPVKIKSNLDNTSIIVPIQEVEVGDYIATISYIDDNDKAQSFAEVQSCMTTTSRYYTELKFDTGHTITCTPLHKFAIDVNGEINWIEAKDLQVGMTARSLCGFAKVVNRKNIHGGMVKHFYNFTVYPTAVYYANDILVHNKNVPPLHRSF